MGEGWEQRNAALPLTAMEAMQLASPGQLSNVFGKEASMTLLVTENVKDLQKTRGESVFGLDRLTQATGKLLLKISIPQKLFRIEE